MGMKTYRVRIPEFHLVVHEVEVQAFDEEHAQVLGEYLLAENLVASKLCPDVDLGKLEDSLQDRMSELSTVEEVGS